MIGTARRRVLVAIAFLAPNLLGFLIFTLGPIVFSLYMSMTDWALTKHNAYSGQTPRFVWFENYRTLLVGAESRFFWDYLGNTLFLMIGIPASIFGSLLLAMLLTAKATPTRLKSRSWGAGSAALLTVIAAVGIWFATTPGPEPKPDEVVLVAEAGLSDLSTWELDRLRSRAAVLATVALGVIVTAGLGIGQVFFRTVYYLPSLLAGVAMFLLWKALYRPEGGLVNAGLEPALASIHVMASSTPGWLWVGAGWALGLGCVALSVRSFGVGVGKLRHKEAGVPSLLGRAFLLATFLLTGLGLAWLLTQLPGMAAERETFRSPEWLVSETWAKPALIVMGVWLGVGGGNMILYLAGLSNVPPELYEAADIDGASGWKRFINVTWPQLAPTTFFIVIMSTIGGLQGGFEQALVMTQGQYDTIVLPYYVYNLAFTDEFRLGLASAVAWIMFAMIFAMTLVNYRFGSQLTND